MEGQVWRTRSERGARVETAEGGELEAEASGRGSDSGQRCAEGLTRKKLVEPAARRTAVSYTIEQHQISERRACRLAGISRSSRCYQPPTQRDESLRERIRDWRGNISDSGTFG